MWSKDRGGKRKDLTPIAAALRQLTASEPITVRIAGECMTPLIPNGARVKVARQRIYWPGDVLVYADTGGRLTAHRLIGACPWRGRLRLFTRADNAASLDGAILPSQVIGRIVGGDCALEIPRVPLAQRVRSAAIFSRAALVRTGLSFFLHKTAISTHLASFSGHRARTEKEKRKT